MKARRPLSRSPQTLRTRAEKQLATTRHDVAQMPVEDAQKLVTELQVHQIELEMQNEELRRIQLELEQTRDRYVELYDFAPSALLTMDAHGKILEANLGAAKLLGMEHARIVGKKLTHFIAPESQDAGYLLCREVFQSQAPQSAELVLVNAQAGRRFVQIAAVRDTRNPGRQCRISFTDITERRQAEDALREQSQFNQQIIASASEGVIVNGRDLKHLVWNPFMEDLTGLPAAQVLGKHPAEIFPFLKTAGVIDQMHRALTGETPAPLDVQFQVPHTGRSGWASNSSGPLRNAQGDIIGVITTVRDITGHKQAETALRKSEERFRALFDSSRDAMMTLEPPSWKFTSGNPASVEMFRIGDEKGFVASAPWELSPKFQPDGRWSREAAQTMIETAMQRGSHFFEWRHRRHDGEEFPATVLLTRVELEGCHFLQATVRDLTEQKRAEERIAQLSRVQAILAGVDHAILHISDQAKLLQEVCRVAVETGGFKLAWIGMVSADGSVKPVAQAGVTEYLKGIRVVAHDAPTGRGAVGRAIREGGLIVIEDMERDGRLAPWRLRLRQFGLNYIAAFPLQVAGQTVGAFQVYAPRAGFYDEKELRLLTQVSDDISYALTSLTEADARRQAESALRLGQQKTRAIFDHTFEFIGLLDPKGIVLEANEASLTFAGINADKVIGRPFWNTPWWIHSPAEQKQLRQAIQKSAAGEFIRFESTHPAADGTLHTIDFSLKPVRDERGRVVWLIPEGRDITERKRMEESLRRSEHHLTNFFNHAPIGLVWLSASGTILRANQSQLDLLGYASADYLGQSFNKFCTEPSQGCELLKRLATRETVRNFPMTRRRRDGQIRQVLVDATPLWSEGQFQYSSVFIRDVTDRRELEQEILHVGEREQRRIAQDLHDGLGQLLVGTAYLTGTLRDKLAAQSLPEAQELGRILDVVYEALAQTRNLARGIHPVESESNGLMVALESLAKQTRKLFRVQCRFTCPRPVLIQNNTIATHLFHITQEAITNAIKHGQPSRITIHLNRTPDQIRLTIRDNGRGLPVRSRKKSGMGLRIMRHRAGIIGGSLTLQNITGGGTAVNCIIRQARAGTLSPQPKPRRKN